jgi:membrane protease subunit HflK
VQQKLDAIESGISVVQVQLVNVTWPMEVDQAFNAFISASQASQQKVTEARTYADTTLTKAGGQVAESLYQALRDQNASESQQAALWAQVTGDVQEAVAQAQTYRTRVVQKARGNADYLGQILPEYRRQPELMTRTIYLDAMQEVLRNVDEKIVFDRCDEAKEREIRVLINRDALLKPKQNPQNPATR